MSALVARAAHGGLPDLEHSGVDPATRRVLDEERGERRAVGGDPGRIEPLGILDADGGPTRRRTLMHSHSTPRSSIPGGSSRLARSDARSSPRARAAAENAKKALPVERSQRPARPTPGQGICQLPRGRLVAGSAEHGDQVDHRLLPHACPSDAQRRRIRDGSGPAPAREPAAGFRHAGPDGVVEHELVDVDVNPAPQPKG